MLHTVPSNCTLQAFVIFRLPDQSRRLLFFRAVADSLPFLRTNTAAEAKCRLDLSNLTKPSIDRLHQSRSVTHCSTHIVFAFHNPLFCRTWSVQYLHLIAFAVRCYHQEPMPSTLFVARLLVVGYFQYSFAYRHLSQHVILIMRCFLARSSHCVRAILQHLRVGFHRT